MLRKFGDIPPPWGYCGALLNDLLTGLTCSEKKGSICQALPITITTTPSPNNDVIIGVVAGVVGLLLVASAVMYLYYGKKRQEVELQKMAIEREMDRQLQLEQQRAMEMESHYSASMESLAREAEVIYEGIWKTG